MWGMKLQARHAKQVRERGAVAAIVAVLMGGGVVMGMLALSIDIGQIMAERRQLQNGADASAMALAQLCAKSDPTCAATTATSPGNDPAASAVKPLAKANAKDNYAAVASVCANAVPTIAVPCETPNASDLAKCSPPPGWLVSGIPYVEVKTKTETPAGGDTVLTPFAKALTGNPANDGSTVHACARSAWGPPGSHTASIPLVFSACEWQGFLTAASGNYAAAPGPNGYGSGAGQVAWPSGSSEWVINLYSSTPSNCAFKGKDTDGGFGWVSNTGCVASVTDLGWVPIDTGKDIPNDCKSRLSAVHNKVIQLPVFDCLVKENGTPPYTDITAINCNPDATGGAQTWYHIKGWATFYVAGFRAPSMTGTSGATGVVPCPNPDSCISGWFLHGELQGASSVVPPSGSNNFGTYAVLAAG